MKYLRLYENFSDNYEVGDYILVEPFTSEERSYPESMAEIIDIPELYNGSAFQILIQDEEEYVWRTDIIRKLTPKEIKEYLLDKEVFIASNKYNV